MPSNSENSNSDHWKLQDVQYTHATIANFSYNNICVKIISLVGKRNKDWPSPNWAKTWLNVTCASHSEHNCADIASTDLYECVITKTRSQSTTKRYLSASKANHRWYKCEVWCPETAARMPSPREASVACWILSLLACNVIINYKFCRSCIKHVVSRPCTLKCYLVTSSTGGTGCTNTVQRCFACNFSSNSM